MRQAKIVFLGEVYVVKFTGTVWCSSDGKQHPRAEMAARRELEISIKASGDSPSDYKSEIKKAIDSIVIN